MSSDRVKDIIKEDLTPRVKQLIEKAKELGQKFKHTEVFPEHFLAALLFFDDCRSIRILYEIGFDPLKLRNWMVKTFFPSLKALKSKEKEYKIKPNPACLAVFKQAAEFAFGQDENWISVDHVFVALLQRKDLLSRKVVEKLDFDIVNFESRILEYFGSEGKVTTNSAPKEKESTQLKLIQANFPNLEKYGINLNIKCYKSEYATYGRSEDLKKIESILNKRDKNNCIIAGDPGIGKTALVECLAYNIANGNSSPLLANKMIYSINANSVVAGTKYRGDFEQRMESILKEASSPNIVLFFDEIHTIMGAGGTEGTLDIANILKPYLSRGEVSVIGATTFQEYRKRIGKDPALDRRFDVIKLKEPNKSEVFKILSNKKGIYQKFHNVEVTDSVIKSVIDYADRYVTSSHFPDKAIGLLDAACSSCRVRKIVKTKSLREKETALVKSMTENSISFEDFDQEQAELFYDFTRSYVKWDRSVQKKTHSVEKQDIIKALSQETGIPESKFYGEEVGKILGLEKKVKSKVFGQSEAIEKICKCLIRYKSGLRDTKKPIGSFLFLGPTGVGKTLLSKVLADEMFISEGSFIRFDMSEYSEEYSLSKLIGSSPGYKDSDNGGILVEKVSQNPYSLLLFDEIEKAHKKIQQVLLQILDEGHVTDSMGRKADFKNCVIIVTGNIGSSELSQKERLGFNFSVSKDDAKSEAFKLLKRSMPIELVNRFDEIVFFNNLTDDNMRAIIKAELKKFSKIPKEGIDIGIRYTDSVTNHILSKVERREFGAREIGRIIQKEILDPISLRILENKCSSYSVSYIKNQLKIKQTKTKK